MEKELKEMQGHNHFHASNQANTEQQHEYEEGMIHQGSLKQRVNDEWKHVNAKVTEHKFMSYDVKNIQKIKVYSKATDLNNQYTLKVTTGMEEEHNFAV